MVMNGSLRLGLSTSGVNEQAVTYSRALFSNDLKE